jgi:hypothetical protein
MAAIGKRMFAGAVLLAALGSDGFAQTPPPSYEPAAVFCYSGAGDLCPVIPSNIVNDPALNAHGLGYSGIFGPQNSAAQDVQSPFDNFSWQSFVALNWKADKLNKPAGEGLQGEGRRVWELYSRASALYRNAPVLATCTIQPGLTIFRIGATPKGQPDGHNEEYIEAATNYPLIDVGGNWTIYERRLNQVEANFLKAPNGNAGQNLTTLDGQEQFYIANKNNKPVVTFPEYNSPNNGAIEIKAAWRILDPRHHDENAKKYYVIKAQLSVPSALVSKPDGTPGGPQICADVELGLTGLHIIQKNQPQGFLPPNWIWSTFEHVDNAPTADPACDQGAPQNCALVSPNDNDPCPTASKEHRFSYYDPDYTGATNQPPLASQPSQGVGGAPYLWNAVAPYAQSYRIQGKYGTQVSRCWNTYPYTAHLNDLWRKKLRDAGSVFANYMLVGTQWGAGTDGFVKNTPQNATLGYLSNSVIETYIQTQYNNAPPLQNFNNGSCISCHGAATLVNQPKQTVPVCNVPSDFSFLPGEANDTLDRSRLLGAQPNCGTSQASR